MSEEIKHVCKACKERVKDWNGSDPVCAFTNDVQHNHTFNVDNYQCATISVIRQLLDRVLTTPHLSLSGISVHLAEEQRYATITVSGVEELWSEDDPCPISLYVGWYKNRGRTECVWLMFESEPPRAPTEEEVIYIIDHLRKLHGDIFVPKT